MRTSAGGERDSGIPKRRRRRNAYDEGVDEPAKLIDLEPVEVETEAPAEENEPVETIERQGEHETPAFEDDEPSNGSSREPLEDVRRDALECEAPSSPPDTPVRYPLF